MPGNRRTGRPNLRRKYVFKRDLYSEAELKEDNTTNRAALRKKIISYTGDTWWRDKPAWRRKRNFSQSKEMFYSKSVAVRTAFLERLRACMTHQSLNIIERARCVRAIHATLCPSYTCFTHPYDDWTGLCINALYLTPRVGTNSVDTTRLKRAWNESYLESDVECFQTARCDTAANQINLVEDDGLWKKPRWQRNEHHQVITWSALMERKILTIQSNINLRRSRDCLYGCVWGCGDEASFKLSTKTHRHYTESVHCKKQHTRGNNTIP